MSVCLNSLPFGSVYRHLYLAFLWLINTFRPFIPNLASANDNSVTMIRTRILRVTSSCLIAAFDRPVDDEDYCPRLMLMFPSPPSTFKPNTGYSIRSTRGSRVIRLTIKLKLKPIWPNHNSVTCFAQVPTCWSQFAVEN